MLLLAVSSRTVAVRMVATARPHIAFLGTGTARHGPSCSGIWILQQQRAESSLSSTSNKTVVERMEDIIDEYRAAHYTQTLPSRFIKEVLTAADENRDGMISVDEVMNLLDHIDSRDKLTREEVLHGMRMEFNVPNNERDAKVPVEQVMEHFLTRIKKKSKARRRMEEEQQQGKQEDDK